jgi:TolA-binding protein
MTAPRTKWVPSDDDLDGLARTLSPPTLGSDESEQHATRLLASAGGIAQQPRSNRAPIFVAAGAIIAAAAAVLLWIGLRTPDGPTATANVVAIGEASFERVHDWPTYALRVDSGRVAIEVSAVEDSQRFIARTSDAELEMRHAKLVMGVTKGHLDAVDVSSGRAELRLSGAPSIYLSAGQSWRPTRTAEVLTPLPPTAPSTPGITQGSASESLVTTPEAPKRKNLAEERDRRSQTPKPTRIETSAPPSVASVSAPAISDAPNPGELEFRAGMAALRSGDAAAAATSFAAACASARGDALAEDACFWVGAAANRAGQASIAREALTRFVQKFPSSARAGEASALLGWLLYQAGDLDAAETRFQHAATDRVPKVKASAGKGLEAIKRRRAHR